MFDCRLLAGISALCQYRQRSSPASIMFADELMPGRSLNQQVHWSPVILIKQECHIFISIA